ncbi:MAG: carbohydrate binding family 9 domain-containing protein [Cytophagia bacterium]|nr:carbohydrate binding family 9 domain-containing protein [Cytophagia bacterium]
MKLKYYLTLTLCLVLSFSYAQGPIISTKADAPPKIDGVLDDDIWQKAPQVTGYKTFVPDFAKEMPYKTIAYMAHDEDNLYFAFKCFDDPNEIKTSIAARDKIGADDWICINLDSFNSGQSLYGIYVNPNGIQMDTRYAAGKEDIGLDLIFYSAAKIVDDGYVVEVKIPFKSIRYKSDDGQVEMGVIFERKISRFSTQGTFPPLDPARGFAFLTQMMPLQYDGVRKSRLVEVLPAITYGVNKSHVNGEYVTESDFEPSLTTKIGITSELVFDATINPDFSQVESDAQQVEVNQRFPVNYPERRPFFLEGNENFNFAGTGGFQPVQMAVNSRSIVTPKFATKLTGKIGDKNIISMIYAVDRDDRINPAIPGLGDNTADVAVMRYMRSLTQDSYVGLLGTSRMQNGGSNNVYGFDGQYRFKEAYQVSGHYLYAENKAVLGGGHLNNAGSMYIGVSKNTRSFNGSFSVLDIGQDFSSGVGYVTRTGISRATLSLNPKIFPKGNGLVKRIDPTLYTSLTKDKPSGLNEHVIYVQLAATLPRNTRLAISADRSSEIYQGQEFNDGSISLNASSQITKRIFFRVNYDWDNGTYYPTAEQGYGKRIGATLNIQASDKFSMDFTHRFASLYSEATDDKYYDIHIARGRLIYQMNKYLFFRGIAQYNSLSKVLSPNFLVSFTYIPGTVVHLGWGSVYEKVRWTGTDYQPSDNYLNTAQGFFFKASYLWRW